MNTPIKTNKSYIQKLEDALKRAGWDGKSNIEEFPYVIGSINDPVVFDHIVDGLGFRIGDKVIAHSDIDNDYYVGTTAKIVGVEHGMLVIKLPNGVVLDDQDPEGFEEANDTEDHIETWSDDLRKFT